VKGPPFALPSFIKVTQNLALQARRGFTFSIVYGQIPKISGAMYCSTEGLQANELI
jgi:hypothetical protein